MLVGDAAHQVNPLSGGGIASGMIGGSIAGRIAGESVKLNKPESYFELMIKFGMNELVNDMKSITG